MTRAAVGFALAHPADAAPPLHARLAALLRPEFQAHVIVVTPGDPVLGFPVCRVEGCGRSGPHAQLCQAHYLRWRGTPNADLTDPTSWVRTADRLSRGRRPLAICPITGCGRGAAQQGLCSEHAGAWVRAGRPDRDLWVAAQPVAVDRGKPACRVAGCPALAESSRPKLCYAHRSRWRDAGRPELEEYLLDVASYGEARFDLRRLQPLARLEVQYALQQRVDNRTTKAAPHQLAPALRALAAGQVRSLLDQPVEDLLRRLPVRKRPGVPAAFLRFAVRCLQDLQEGTGWEAEYPRDLWLLRRVGLARSGHPASLDFRGIDAGWLRELAKRWARLRLSNGLGTGTVAHDIRAIISLGQFLEEVRPGSVSAGVLTRELLERWIASLQQLPPKARGRQIGCMTTFLRGVHQHQWAPQLHAAVQLHREDLPARPELAPRFVSEFVMAQLESPEALNQLTDGQFRLATQLIIGTGLRVGDALQLALDCLLQDSQGSSYLRYRNHKMNREAFVPLSEDLADLLRGQQRRVLDRWSDGPVLFPRRTANPYGRRSISNGSYRQALLRWLQTCDVRDELGQLVRVTPHQWRHTYATRLVNNDCPIEIVRQLLDHSSHAMTAHYARVADKTVRQHWERATKVNARGEPVTLDTDSPLADAAWMRQGLSRATQVLPNGYCGLPIQRTCPHANACLDCPVFVTTPDFLPQHQEHLDTTRRLIATAEANGQFRMVEMNKRVEDNLNRIIGALQQDSVRPDQDDNQGAGSAS